MKEFYTEREWKVPKLHGKLVANNQDFKRQWLLSLSYLSFSTPLALKISFCIVNCEPSLSKIFNHYLELQNRINHLSAETLRKCFSSHNFVSGIVRLYWFYFLIRIWKIIDPITILRKVDGYINGENFIRVVYSDKYQLGTVYE